MALRRMFKTLQVSWIEPANSAIQKKFFHTSPAVFGAKKVVTSNLDTKREWNSCLTKSLVGSCTNSSYEDMARCVTIAKQALDHGRKSRIPFNVTPGSEQIRATIKRDGIVYKNIITGLKDANAATHAFITSPELVTALVIEPRLDFDPTKDSIKGADGKEFTLEPRHLVGFNRLTPVKPLKCTLS
ncbi:probable aconitate hydratase, mitochondrial [Aphis gossypii]|uniref:probable aconitate hydratase, mitochondrial n=1 Tax=Aphis gossypii TaxID=80765 RepID=UPI002159AB8B|nr:probable aconitate hydratase, mitochondrial [Aphis gossypii]